MRNFKHIALFVIVFLVAGHDLYAQRLDEKAVATIDQAMSDELARSKEKLRLAGLTNPFYVSYTVNDNSRLEISAAFGALTKSQESRNRQFSLRLMVGDYALNDENFSDGGGGIFGGGGPQIDQTLPLDNDYTIIRRGLWLATDNLFKEANETFTKKKAALERKQLSEEDKNLPDFAKAPVANVVEPPKESTYDRKALESFIRDLSAIFVKYPELQNSTVSLNHNNTYQIFKSTEGTSFRRPSLTCDLTVQASAQALDDGEPMSLAFTVSAPSPDDLDQKAIRQQTEQLAKTLAALIRAPKYDDKEYTGPVMFEGDASRSLLGEHLIAKFAAQREDVLGGGNVFVMGGSGAKGTFQKKLGTRVLPTSITVRDNPLMKPKTGSPFLGNYSIDEEGVVPTEMTLVDKGILKTLYNTRTPSKELRDPNGHARNAGGQAVPGPGVVEIIDAKAVTSANMKKDLLKRAKENGYDFTFIVRSLDKGTLIFSDGMGNFGDLMEGQKSIQPSIVYKVSTKDGSEQLIRGVELSFPTARDMREIITSKERSTVDMNLPGGGNAGLFGFGGKVAATIIGPERIMFPELEARKKKTSAYPTRPVVARPN